jgi:hypothetical protein
MRIDAMDKEVWDQMPEEIKQLNGCFFTDAFGTDYVIRSVESDTSRLVWRDDVGTCMDPALPRKYEIRVYEVQRVKEQPDQFSYFGLSGQFTQASDIPKNYGVAMDEILSSKATIH